MYAWIWRKLPFGLWGKFTGSIVLSVGVFLLLWYVVFPAATPLLPFDDVQVGSDTQQGPAQEDPNAVISNAPTGPAQAPGDTPSSSGSSPTSVTPSKSSGGSIVLPGD